MREEDTLHEQLIGGTEMPGHRPRHPLVSHLSVPYLHVDAVHQTLDRHRGVGAEEALAALAEAPAPSPRSNRNAPGSASEAAEPGVAIASNVLPSSGAGETGSTAPIARPRLVRVEREAVGRESSERPWGRGTSSDGGQGYKVKRIHVLSGHKMSYQTHKHRSEHRVVTFRMATCLIDGETFVAGPAKFVDVATGAAHRIENRHAEELIIIEVQHRAYTGDDDICRLKDDYGRSDPLLNDGRVAGAISAPPPPGRTGATRAALRSRS